MYFISTVDIFLMFMTLQLTNLSSALRLPISCGFILVALTTEETETRDWVCEIMRDLIGVSIATTSTWAIITIMFRSDPQDKALKKVLKGFY